MHPLTATIPLHLRNERGAALAHERSYLEARDPALLLLGLLLITLFPWNLPLWWQLRRLRFAIEVDCDARVLTRGLTPRDYGSALLAISERGIAAPMGAVALTEPASQLLRRIKIMTTDIAKPGKAAVLATIVLVSACIGAAARTQAPSLTTDLPRKLPADESNSHPEIEALVRATYPQFFRDAGNTGPELVNLFLNPDGSLYKSVVEAIAPRPYITKSFQAFEQVGIDYEHRGPHVWFRMTGASGLPVDVIAWYFQAPAYFPDLYTHPWDWPRADPWVLLDRQGKVLATGRRAVNSKYDVKLNIESQYPGIKTDQWQIAVLNGPRGEEAEVSSGDQTFYTQMLALNFGGSGVTQCALRNPFGVVYLQVAVNEGDPDAAAVRIRAQHLPLPNSEAIPEAVATAWSSQSAPVRALYNAPSAPLEITDADGKKWTIVLHTDRLKHAAPVKNHV